MVNCNPNIISFKVYIISSEDFVIIFVEHIESSNSLMRLPMLWWVGALADLLDLNFGDAHPLLWIKKLISTGYIESCIQTENRLLGLRFQRWFQAHNLLWISWRQSPRAILIQHERWMILFENKLTFMLVYTILTNWK